MNGAESLVRTLLASGVDVCLANPGTSEMHFVSALDRVAGMRCVLGLFEGVVSGAADGYARMAGKPAATLFHCGPGLANGIANLHNAKRARVPLVNIIGDQATYHKPLHPPLAADTEALAATVSQWVRTAARVEDVGTEAAAAVAAARAAPGSIASLILPSDVSWNEGGAIASPLAIAPAEHIVEAAIAEAAALLRSGEPTLLLLGGAALSGRALLDAARIATLPNVKLMAENFNARVERGGDRPFVPRIPYPIDAALAALAGVRNVILIGARDPVAFFAYPGKPGRLLPDSAVVHDLATPADDVGDALARLADAVGVGPYAPAPQAPTPDVPGGAVTPEAVAAALAALLPEGAIVADEGLTFGFALYPNTGNAAPHDWLQLMGGAIGNGPPLATGAALGAPGRRVINVQGDGSALYTIQALWTQARERLDVTTIIFANRRYEILFDELKNVGAAAGAASRALFDIADPAIDWRALATSFGVESARAETMKEFTDLFGVANRWRGPFLIELVVP
ncbi:MAG TPA: acetolactate synthase large subunit [Bauldia sp.]|nr:acetolactate synthase large subunit [Bauldia sp.]